MKFICIVVGLALIVIAGVYFVLPADQLPAFLPGHVAGEARVHYKHGIASGLVGLVFLVVGWRMGRP